MSRWDILVENHKSRVAEKASAKELAFIENDLIALVPYKGEQSQWTKIVFGKIGAATGCTLYDLKMRRSLFTAGWPADPLWDRVQSGMKLATAVQILRDARRRSKQGTPTGLRREIETALRAIDGAPLEEGEEGENEKPDLPTEGRDFWSHLRKGLANYARERLSEVQEQERELLVTKLLTDLRVTTDAHQQIWYATLREQRDAKKVSRQHLIDALRILHLDPPKRMQPLNEVLEKARKQQRMLARQYHPDRHGGSERTRPQYEAVINAYNIVEKYTRENTSNEKTSNGASK